MQKRTSKKILLPLLLLSFCFITMKAPAFPPQVPDTDISYQVMPLSDMEEEFNSEDE